MSSYRSGHEAAGKHDANPDMANQDPVSSKSRDAKAPDVAGPQIIIESFENDIDVEAGSFQEGRPYDSLDSTIRGRASTSDRQRTESFVRESQRNLGGAKHRRSKRAHRSQERRRTKALNDLAAFERLYNSQGRSQDNSGASAQEDISK